MLPPDGNVSTLWPSFASEMPQAEIPPVQYVSPVVEVIFDCAGVGTLCGVLLSSSITQSALPAVSPWEASNKNFFTVLIALIVNIDVQLVPPPGAGVKTVIFAVPAVAILVAGTIAVNCVAPA